MSELSQAQEFALRILDVDEWRSSYDLRVSMATLDALVRRGLVRKRGGHKLGAMFSPRTTIEYALVSEEEGSTE